MTAYILAIIKFVRKVLEQDRMRNIALNERTAA